MERSRLEEGEESNIYARGDDQVGRRASQRLKGADKVRVNQKYCCSQVDDFTCEVTISPSRGRLCNARGHVCSPYFYTKARIRYH